MKKDAKTLLKEKKARLRAQNQKARADALFIVYFDMGPERSLEKLHDHLTELGLKRSLTTLKNYSIKYDWQERLIEEDTRRAEREQADAESVRYKMLERHTRMGQTLQSLAMAGMFTFQQAMAQGGSLEFSPTEIVALAKAGTDLELRASGEPTLRVEITTVLYNVLIARIAHIFKEVNILSTPDARENRFATMVDQMQSHAINEVTKLLEQ